MKRHGVLVFLLAVSVLFNVFFIAGYVRAMKLAGDAAAAGEGGGTGATGTGTEGSGGGAVGAAADADEVTRRVAAELGLDASQSAMFMQLHRELREDEQIHRESLALVRQELIDALQTEKIEPSVAREIMRREAELHQELKLMAAQRFGQFMATLTPQQREKLQQRLRMQRPGGGRGGERRPPPHVMERFDANKDGNLDEAEKRQWMKTWPQRGGPGGWGDRERESGDRADRAERGEREDWGDRGPRPPRSDVMPSQRGPDDRRAGEFLEHRVRMEIMRRFDADQDGVLNDIERAELVRWLAQPVERGDDDEL